MENPSETGLKLLYVTPEKVAKAKMLMSKLEKCAGNGKLQRIVIGNKPLHSSDTPFVSLMRKGLPTLFLLSGGLLGMTDVDNVSTRMGDMWHVLCCCVGGVFCTKRSRTRKMLLNCFRYGFSNDQL